MSSQEPSEPDAEAATKPTGPEHASAKPWTGEGSLGRYEIRARVGQGAMGAVLRAHDPKLQRDVALKILHTAALSTEAVARLVFEARAMARVNHPNVVAVYDVEIDLPQAPVVLAMEYVDGPTLRTWLRSEPRTWQVIVEAFVAAGRGLAAAHAQGLLHRDFKPANVLVGTQVKVTDFGLARPATSMGGASDSGSDSGSDSDETEHPLESLSPDATATGWVMGTPRYMAPEQHRAHALTPAADQYAFCVALWEALAGRPPFEGDEDLGRKAKGPPPWPTTVRVPPRIVAALERGLAPRPADRWPNMGALLGALANDVRGAGHAKRLAGLAAGGVLVVGAVVATVVYLSQRAVTPVEPSAEGLLAVLSFDDGSDPMRVDGGSLAATCTSCPAWSPDGKTGGALLFDGATQHLRIADDGTFATPGGFTAGVWIRLRGLDSWRRTAFFCKPLDVAGGVGDSWCLAAEQDGRTFFYTSDVDGSDFLRGPTLELDRWTHLAGTWDGTTKRLYFDGAEVASADATIGFSDDALVVGGDVDDGAFDFGMNGWVDDARVWGRALSPAEIAGLAGR